MSENLASVRLRVSLHAHLRFLAADLSRQRQTRITMRSLLEEGIGNVLTQSLSAWVEWASQGVATVDGGEESLSFRIHADLVRELGVLAAQMTVQSKVPITKVHLLEEAGRRIIAQVQAEQKEMKALLQSPEGP